MNHDNADAPFEQEYPYTLKFISHMKTVGVQYRTSSKMYIFMTDEECEVGDKAVVFTSGAWNVVTIKEVHDGPEFKEGIQCTWLVQIVDRTNYDRHIIEDGEGYDQSVRTRL